MKLTLLLTTLAGFATAATKGGLDYIMVGDFGWTFNMSNSQKNFDAIDKYVGNLN